eukprot:gi/632984741/ref/XP_007909294.1/ PREDICTED: scavenger receptor cysteine-rich type 1 protein M130-like [Callorhinchus milii]
MGSAVLWECLRLGMFGPWGVAVLLGVPSPGFELLCLEWCCSGNTESVSMRLVNGSSPCAGRVELHHDGQWGTVYGYGWNMTAAAVVCKELGCGAALSAPGGAHFGEGSGHIVTYNVQCRGNESALSDCPSWPWGQYSASHSFDASVICSGEKNPRLVNGSSHCAGRVELYTMDNWGTVCGETLNMEMAGNICKYLGCGFAVSASGDAHFGEGSGPVVGRPDCGHGKDGGILCSANRTRVQTIGLAFGIVSALVITVLILGFCVYKKDVMVQMPPHSIPDVDADETYTNLTLRNRRENGCKIGVEDDPIYANTSCR